MKTTHIYMLIDPRDEMVRYVGKTNQDVKKRLSAHMGDKSNCHRVHWLNTLKKLGLKPEIILLESISGEWPWQESEKYWIKYFKDQGFNLTNNTSGGDGVPDLPQETRDKMRLTWLGRKHKPETILLLRIANKGRKHTPEHKQHMKEIMTGRTNTWGDKVAETIRKVSKEEAENIKQRLNNGELVKDLALEYKMHRTSISKIKKGVYFEKYRTK